MDQVKHAAEVAREKVKEGYQYVAHAISGADETQVKELDPESKQRLEDRIERFNDERELARQRMDESSSPTDLKSGKISSQQKGDPLLGQSKQKGGIKSKEGQNF